MARGMEEAKMDDKLAATLQSSRLLPEHWKCGKHDKTLLKVVSEKGISFLDGMSNNPDYDFQDFELSGEVLFKRVEEVCEFFKQLN